MVNLVLFHKYNNNIPVFHATWSQITLQPSPLSSTGVTFSRGCVPPPTGHELLSPNGAIQAAADSTEREEAIDVDQDDDVEHDEEMCESDEETTEIDTDGRCRKRKRRILFSKTQTYELERRWTLLYIFYYIIRISLEILRLENNTLAWINMMTNYFIFFWTIWGKPTSSIIQISPATIPVSARERTPGVPH